MSYRYAGVGVVLLLLPTFGHGQAGQSVTADKQRAANAPQQKEAERKQDSADALASFMGGAHIDKESAERGRKIFVPTCGFCHGNDAHGKSGPDLVRSALVLHDNKGDAISPVIRNGRTERGMPAFSALSAEQIADISMFLHSRAA